MCVNLFVGNAEEYVEDEEDEDDYLMTSIDD